MDAGSLSTTNTTREDNERMIRACAEACGVGREIVEKISLASEDQEYRMDHHIKTGLSYIMHMVLEYEGVMNEDFLLRGLSTIRLKNHVLRTRLIRHEGHVYQVVLRDALVFRQIADSFQVFLTQHAQERMDYGTPLVRYTLIREPHGESFFVWSVHCSAVDAWTLRLMFNDFQAACSNLAAYSNLPPRPSYRRYIRWCEQRSDGDGRTFWQTRHTALDKLQQTFPVLGLGPIPSISTSGIKRLLHIPKAESTEFTLAIRGYAAWALTIATFLPPGNLHTIKNDITFLSMTSARRSDVAGIEHIMGPISARVPLRICFFPNTPIEDLMRDIKSQFSSMVGFEHCAMKVLSNDGGLKNMPRQAVFNWNPPGSDVSSKRVICHDKEVAPAVLAYRDDLSVPLAHEYGLMFEVHEHGAHISIHATWDPNIVANDLVSRLLGDFKNFLTLIIKKGGATVPELLAENKALLAGQVADSRPRTGGLRPV